MDRRAVGAMVVILTVIVALAVPNALGRRLAGAAIRTPIPPPPVVGQCLLAPAKPAGYTNMTIGAAPVGTCGDTNFGEVVSVTDHLDSFPSGVTDRMFYPYVGACQPDADRYLGWPAESDDLVANADSALTAGSRSSPWSSGLWRPVATESMALVGPDISQYLTGQDWIACVILPPAGSYSGSVKDGRAGSAADAFAWCGADTRTALHRVPCGVPHDSEMFASVVFDATGGDVDSELLASCTRLVATATGMSDLSAGGLLTVRLDVGATVDGRPGPPDDGAAHPKRAKCSLEVARGDRRLGGSLTGRGVGPLPWV